MSHHINREEVLGYLILWRFILSKTLALVVLIILAILCLSGGWLKWFKPEVDLFSSPLFLMVVAILFLNTLACTVQRTGFVFSLLRGRLKGNPLVFPSGGISFEDFLREKGFRGFSKVYFKNRIALLKGWLFHIGILTMLLGIFLQQALYEEGVFDITVGQTLRLPDDVIEKKRGILRRDEATAEFTLLDFDPFYYQEGYARDRLSKLIVNYSNKTYPVLLNRVKGERIDSLTIYQAIPHGLSLVVEIDGKGLFTFALKDHTEKEARVDFLDPSGEKATFLIKTENPLHDPKGVGDFRLYYKRDGDTLEITKGKEFSLGGLKARLVDIKRWSRFTYAINPGMPFVFLGFFITVSGVFILLFQGGIAFPDETGHVAGYVYLTHGGEDMLKEWLLRSKDGV